MSWALAAGLAAILAGGTIQSGTGFGFALVAAPVLTAVFGPRASVSALSVLGLVVTVMTLSAERRPLRVMRGRAALIAGASLPGMALGALVLRHASTDVLRLLVAVAVLVAVAITARAPREATAHGRGAGAAGGVGLVSGALSTSTGINGPPIVLHLLRRGADAAQARDTLAAIFVVSGVATIAILLVAGTFDPPAGLPALAAAAAVGQLAGRRLFVRIQERHRAAALGVLVLSALVALAPAAQALL